MQVFMIAPASGRGTWILPIVLAAVLVPIVVVLALSLLGARQARFEISPDGLRIRGDLYGRTIPLSQLRLADARRVDFEAAPDLVPTLRTFGTGLPGYQSGWFRLRNGERALLYLTDRRRAVYLPTTDGYSLLLSPEAPDAFVAALRGGKGTS